MTLQRKGSWLVVWCVICSVIWGMWRARSKICWIEISKEPLFREQLSPVVSMKMMPMPMSE